MQRNGLSIGNITISPPLILAPMSGVSDLTYRLISRSFGAPFAFTEMISARALTYRNKRCLDMLVSSPADRPLGVQLLGNDPDVLLAALDVLEAHQFDLVDLNAACPVAKVVRRGEGAGLLREPSRVAKLLGVLVTRVKVPVTIKIRAGWDERSINAREVAIVAEDAGAAAIFVHGRTRSQGYKGEVDYRIIRAVKEAVKIPVVGSGDVFSAELAMKMLEETGCDGVAMARGAMGNPWIFNQTVALLSGEEHIPTPAPDEIVSAMKEHLALLVESLGEKLGVVVFRKFFVWYARGFHHIRALRVKALRATRLSDVLDAIESIRDLS
jgi:tRNA-dihydrouridine synthase B